MIDVNSGIELINQGKVNAIMDSVETADPLLHQSLLALEDTLTAIAEQEEERLQLIEEGMIHDEMDYDFNPKDFNKTIRFVVEMLKNNGNIPDSIENAFDRCRYANAWTDFNDALCFMGVNSEGAAPKVTSEEAIVSLGNLFINEDFVQTYLRPHGFSLYRHDPKSPYNLISEDLSLPYFTFTEGVMVYSSNIATNVKGLWWYEVMDASHTRWEKILNAVADITQASVGHPEEDFYPGED